MAFKSKSLETYYYRFLLKNFPVLILIVFILLTIMAVYLMAKRIKKTNVCNVHCYSPEMYNKNKDFCVYMCSDKTIPLVETDV
jgi:hypothetical protein